MLQPERLWLGIAAAAALGGAPAAQGPINATDLVIGWSDLPAPAATGYLDIQDVDSKCQPAKTICQTVAPMVRAVQSFAGGTAYDPRHQTVWVSDGDLLGEYLVPGSTRACRPRCPIQKAVKLNTQASVSGLAHSDWRPRLFQLATTFYYLEVVTYDNSQKTSKCPTPLARCSLDLRLFYANRRPVAGGLAYDETNDLLFISVSAIRSTGGFDNYLWVTDATNGPCKPICQQQFFTCSANVVTGLAYDACRRILYATDGQITQPYAVGDPRKCQIKPANCCKKQHNPIYRGLAVVPGWRKALVGRPCTGRPCPTCTSMSFVCTGGDPSLGNMGFGFQLTGAPSGGFGVFVLGAGSCTTGLPFGCGALYPALAPPPFVFPAVPLGGGGSCNGQAPFPLPIPPFVGLCKQAFCAQVAVFCVQSVGVGIGLTNAITFTIAGS